MTADGRPTFIGAAAGARRVFLVAVPVLVGLVIVGHPPDPGTATDLGAQTDRYIWIHVGLLFVLPLVGMVVWILLDGLTGGAATTARMLVPVTLVFYAAFDALVGIGSGVLAREALQMSGGELAGAHALAARWMEIPWPVPLVSGIGTISWAVALLAAALAHWQAGSSWIVVGGLASAGPLFGFGHPLITGIIGMAGLAVAGLAVERRRAGAVEHGT